MKTLNNILFLLLILSAVGCARTAPIRNFQNVAYDMSKHMESYKIRQLIYAACLDAGWKAELSSPQTITATYTVGNAKHVAVVNIQLQPNFYDIVYHDSKNLKYEANGIIHRNYNRWVSLLKMKIDFFLKNPDQLDVGLLPPELLYQEQQTAKSSISERQLPVCNDAPEQTISGQAGINRSLINIRKGAGIHCTTVGILKKGQVVSLKGKKDDWYLVSSQDEIEGWVFSPFLSQ